MSKRPTSTEVKSAMAEAQKATIDYFIRTAERKDPDAVYDLDGLRWFRPTVEMQVAYIDKRGQKMIDGLDVDTPTLAMLLKRWPEEIHYYTQVARAYADKYGKAKGPEGQLLITLVSVFGLASDEFVLEAFVTLHPVFAPAPVYARGFQFAKSVLQAIGFRR